MQTKVKRGTMCLTLANLVNIIKVSRCHFRHGQQLTSLILLSHVWKGLTKSPLSFTANQATPVYHFQSLLAKFEHYCIIR